MVGASQEGALVQGRSRVLLVDDRDDTDRIASQLTDAGYDVEVAAARTPALSRLRRPPRVAAVIVRLRRTADRRALLGALQEREATQRVAVVVVRSRDDERALGSAEEPRRVTPLLPRRAAARRS